MRILEIVKSSIELDILTAEEELEKTINDTGISVVEKTELIKKHLGIVVDSQIKLAKWVDYMSNIQGEINNNNQKTNEND